MFLPVGGWLDPSGPGEQAVYRGRWTASAAEHWRSLGGPALGWLTGTSDDASSLLDLDGLTHLALSGPMANDSAVSKMSGLRSLTLNTDRETRIDFRQLTNLRQLAMTDRRGPGFGELTRLEWLHMGWRPADLEALTGLESLRWLQLNPARALTNLSALENLPLLGDLELDYAPRVADLAPLARCPSLYRLTLHACTGLTSVAGLVGATGLTHLVLHSCRNLASVAPLADIPSLQSVIISGSTNIPDGKISTLLELPNLRSVGLRNRVHYDITQAEIDQELEARGVRVDWLPWPAGPDDLD